MIEHLHIWIPVPLQRGRYSCGCGAFGYRARDCIRVVRRKAKHEPAPTARAVMLNDGRIPARPTLDEQERR